MTAPMMMRAEMMRTMKTVATPAVSRRDLARTASVVLAALGAWTHVSLSDTACSSDARRRHAPRQNGQLPPRGLRRGLQCTLAAGAVCALLVLRGGVADHYQDASAYSGGTHVPGRGRGRPGEGGKGGGGSGVCGPSLTGASRYDDTTVSHRLPPSYRPQS